ncbi:MAG: ABC transporter substrate-binding protein [Candidatus Hermodarchaeota archaeon]
MAKFINLAAGVIFIIFFSPVTVITAPMTSMKFNWAPNFRPHGGYVDEILFVQYPSEDYKQVMYALQSGEIDACAGQIPVKYAPGLLTYPNISVQIEPNNRFRHIALNCCLFPTNITGYRRALVYGIDKHKISMEVTGGAGKPFDSYIPPCATEWQIESSLSEHFYDKNIAKGNASLEAAGFKDLDNDGWREYDVNDNNVWDETIDIDDQGCKIKVTGTKGYEPAIISCQVAVEGLLEMGMRAEVNEWDPYDWGVEREAICFSEDVDFVNPASFIYDFFRSDQPYHEMFIMLNNASINDALDAMMDATTLEEAKAKCVKAAELLVFEQPLVICYSDIYTNAYRTNKFEGFFKFSGKGFTGDNPHMGTKVHLKESLGGPFGGTLRIAMSEDLESSNILLATETATTMVINYIYEGLWQLDPHTWDPIPGLAYNWTTEQTTAGGGLQAGQKSTFKLYENATWHDGKNVTSADVKYTWENVWPSSPDLGYILDHVYKVEAPDNYTVEIYSNNTGYFEWSRTTGALVLPKHIWKQHEPYYEEWEPESSEIIGSGPYKWNIYTPNKSISLLRYNDWRWRKEEPTTPATRIPWNMLIGLLLLGGIIVVLGLTIIRQRA